MTVTDRHLSILAVVALLMVVVTVVLYGTERSRARDFEKGALLIPQGLELDNVAKLTLKEKDKTLSLVRQGRGFAIVQSSNYTADTKGAVWIANSGVVAKRSSEQ